MAKSARGVSSMSWELRGYRVLSALVILSASVVGRAEGFTPGDILVSEAPSGSSGAAEPSTIREYTPTGVLVQTLQVPVLPGQDNTDYTRGMAIDSSGRLDVFNGTFHVGISTYDPTTNSWSSTLLPAEVFNGGNYGHIATYGKYVFLENEIATDSTPAGIIRLDTTTGLWQQINAPDPGGYSNDLSMGPGGLLYSLDTPTDGDVSVTPIRVYDPNTLSLVKTIPLDQTLYGFGSDVLPVPDGTFWLCEDVPPAYRVDSNGHIIGIHSFDIPSTTWIDDYEISADGTIMRVETNGHINLYDSNFNALNDFSTTNPYAFGSFGAFVPAPEPGSVVALTLSLAILARKRLGASRAPVAASVKAVEDALQS